MLDLNDAQPQRGDLIPPGCAKVQAVLRPGGATMPGAPASDVGLLRASRSSDVLMLHVEFTVLEGPHANRRFWQNMTVAGGEVDENGQSKGWLVTKATLRAIIESALGLDPKDESEAAKVKRRLTDFRSLSGIRFVAKIGVRQDRTGQYGDQNVLAAAVTPDRPEWRQVMEGGHAGSFAAPAASRPVPAAAQPAWAAPPSPQAPRPPAATSQPAWASSAPAAAPASPSPAPAQPAGPAWLNA